MPPRQDPGPDNIVLVRENNLTVSALMAKLQEHYGFFSEMTEKEMVRFLRLCSRRSYEEGEVIFEEGEMGDCFYLVVFGEVRVRQNEVEIGLLEPGHCFGEMAILESAPRSATAEATQKTLVFCVERDILTDVFPTLGFKVAANLAKDLSRKLRETIDRLKQYEEKNAAG